MENTHQISQQLLDFSDDQLNIGQSHHFSTNKIKLRRVWMTLFIILISIVISNAQDQTFKSSRQFTNGIEDFEQSETVLTISESTQTITVETSLDERAHKKQYSIELISKHSNGDITYSCKAIDPYAQTNCVFEMREELILLSYWNISSGSISECYYYLDSKLKSEKYGDTILTYTCKGERRSRFEGGKPIVTYDDKSGLSTIYVNLISMVIYVEKRYGIEQTYYIKAIKEYDNYDFYQCTQRGRKEDQTFTISVMDNRLFIQPNDNDQMESKLFYIID